MIFAQIQNGLIQNTIMIDDMSLLYLFQNDPTGNPYDFVLQIDQLYPRPGIGWSFNGIYFTSPNDPDDDGDDDSEDGGDGGDGGLLGGLGL